MFTFYLFSHINFKKNKTQWWLLLRLSLGGTILNCLGTAAAAAGTVLACGPGEVIPVGGQVTCGLAAAGTLSTGANCYDGIFD